MRNNLIKIFIGYHKPDFLIKSNIFEPIFLGREIYTQETKDGYITDSGFSFLSENMLQDNIGFNISHLNRYFCELTGIYWIWKNYSNLYNLDYIGFMHYRRHFISKDLSSFLKLDSDARYSYIINKIDYTYIKYINDFLKDKIECDLIIPYMFDFKKSLFHEINIEEFFCRQHGLTNASFKTLEYIIKYKYPDYYDIFIEFSKGTAYYPCNMFIMKKELFCKYCTFLFDIMFSLFDIFEEMLKNLDSLWEKRNLAWISEFVSTLFFLKYIRDNHNNVEFLPISFVQNTIENKMVGAVKIVENHLSYKIGKKIIHSKGLINILLLPFSIICIYFNHYLEKYIYNISIKYNPNSKRIKLEEYSDYDEAVRIQNYLSYKIGKIFVKNPFLFAIRLYFLKKERKNEKK